MQNSTHDLIDIQNYIFACESTFFYEHALPVDYSKLNINLDSYDCKYENKVRRKELNAVYLLEEILNEKNLSSFGCRNSMYELEDFYFSADFYRNIVFHKDITSFKKQYCAFCSLFEKNIKIFEKQITDKDYLEISVAFDYLHPAPTKEAFMNELHELERFLLTRKNIFTAAILVAA